MLANAADAPAFAAVPAMKRLRGQVSELPGDWIVAPRHPVAGDGYVMPSIDGTVFVGATYEFDGDPSATGLLHQAHAENVDQLARLLDVAPRHATADEIDALDGRVGWRAVNLDRLPSIGHFEAQDPRRSIVAGLGSRGVTWAALAGEQLAALLAGDPEPLERRLAKATDPVRFARRGRPA
ncbi:hypothetical protein BH10PSE17_BH10PSE17_35520 [soil metagenome]